MKFLYPPRPKGKMLFSELDYYESTGKWIAQRKFRGSRCLVCITPEEKVYAISRHGKTFSNFQLDDSYKKEIMENLNLEKGKEYWLDGELMNKDKNSKNEIVFFDVLQVGKYFFRNPNQLERLKILSDICKNPIKKCASGFALEISSRLLMAETFFKDFYNYFNESLNVPQLEGLVLRKIDSALDHFGNSMYETSNLIRCRKPFNCDDPKENRSGGYEF